MKATHFPGIPQPMTEHHDVRGLTNIGCLSRSSLYLSSLWTRQDFLRAVLHSEAHSPSFSHIFHGCQPYFMVWRLSLSVLLPFLLSFIGNMPNKSLIHLPLSRHLLSKETTCQKSLKLHTNKLSRIPWEKRLCIVMGENTTWGSPSESSCDSPVVGSPLFLLHLS